MCLWISAVLALLVATAQVLGLVAIVGGATPGMTGVIGVLTAGLLALVAVKLTAGRNWARWLYVVIYVSGSLLGVGLIFVLVPAVFLAQPAILKMNMVVQCGLQTAALIFMFSSKSRQWFGGKKQ